MPKTGKSLKQRKKQRERRRRRVRSKINSSAQLPRLSVFRSNRHIYAQLINDEKGVTLAAACDLHLSRNKQKNANSKEIAFQVGKLIAQRAQDLGIKEASFDRGAYKYHGRVKALAEGAREGGLGL